MDHDFCNSDGARRLKARIEEYWRERGFEVEVRTVEAGFVAAMRSARTDVRSDMVNGFPAGAKLTRELARTIHVATSPYGRQERQARTIRRKHCQAPADESERELEIA